jgi:phage-related minor tail protein
MFPLDAVLGIGNKLIDHFFPDASQAAGAKLKLLEMQQTGELAKINADISEAQEVTKRWQSDMTSDSWLSKNIRPMALIAIFAGYFVFAMMSAFGYSATESYVQLLGQWGQIVFLAYFGGRTVEKVMEMKSKKDEPK